MPTEFDIIQKQIEGLEAVKEALDRRADDPKGDDEQIVADLRRAAMDIDDQIGQLERRQAALNRNSLPPADPGRLAALERAVAQLDKDIDSSAALDKILASAAALKNLPA
jgi:hypothetical protein